MNRFLIATLATAIVLLAGAAPADAQSNTLRSVSFTASTDHNTQTADGTAVLTQYEIVIVRLSPSPQTVATIDLGKPTPNAQQLITVANVPIGQTLTPGEYEGRLTAVGPGGRSAAVVDPFSRPSAPTAPTGLQVLP